MLPFELFRKDVVRARGQRMLGDVVLVYPISNYVLVVLFLGLVASTVVAFAFGSYTRRASVPGVLEPEQGVIKLYAAQSGSLRERRVKEGMPVSKGAVLLVFTSESGDANGAPVEKLMDRKLEDQLRELRRELQHTISLAAVDNLNEREQVAALQQGSDALRIQLFTQQERLASSRRAFERFDSLRQSGFMSEMQVQQKHDEMIDQQLRTDELKKSLAASESDLRKVRLLLSSAPLHLEIAKAQLQRSIAAAEANLSKQAYAHEWAILAPCDGVVAELSIATRQTAMAGMPLMTIMPRDSALEASLSVPSHSLGFIRRGQTVRMKLDAFPFQKFGFAMGTVTAISDAPVQGGDNSTTFKTTGATTGVPQYLVRVRLARQTMLTYGNAQQLRPGMQLQADIALDTRSLGEWLLAPLYSMRLD